jgi:polyamine oxidase
MFGAMVKNVAYDTKGVTVSLTDGRTFQSKIAITTFPLGVLNRQHKELFTPNVPRKLAKILDSGDFVMSNLTRIYIQFPSVFWDNNAEAFLVADANGHPGELPEFQNLNHADRTPGSNTLLLFLGNPESVKYENMDDADVQAAVVEKLKATFPDATVPEPSAFTMTRWGLDPLAFGCYSALNVGFVDDSYETINTPLADNNGDTRVYLGGEAMCDDLSGSTYGAHQSGRQIVQSYLFETHRGKKPIDICWA